MSVSGGPNPGKSGFRWARDRDGRQSTPATDSLNIDHLYDVAARLRHIHFIQGDGIKLIDAHAGVASALIWCDPPFLRETRASGAGTYRHETSAQLHQGIATALRKCAGYALITGYGWNKGGSKNRVYEELYEAHGWRRVDSERRVNGGGTRVQSLWISPQTWRALEAERVGRELPLFAHAGLDAK
jgi:DNA adenine methylase